MKIRNPLIKKVSESHTIQESGKKHPGNEAPVKIEVWVSPVKKARASTGRKED